MSVFHLATANFRRGFQIFDAKRRSHTTAVFSGKSVSRLISPTSPTSRVLGLGVGYTFAYPCQDGVPSRVFFSGVWTGGLCCLSCRACLPTPPTCAPSRGKRTISGSVSNSSSVSHHTLPWFVVVAKDGMEKDEPHSPPAMLYERHGRCVAAENVVLFAMAKMHSLFLRVQPLLVRLMTVNVLRERFEVFPTQIYLLRLCVLMCPAPRLPHELLHDAAFGSGPRVAVGFTLGDGRDCPMGFPGAFQTQPMMSSSIRSCSRFQNFWGILLVCY